MGGEGDELVDGGQRLLGGVHRVGAGGPEDAGVGLGDGLDGGCLSQAGADGDHAGHAGGGGAGDDSRDLAREIGEVEMAMAVDKLGLGGGQGHHGFLQAEGQAAWARASAAAASICRKVSRITWAGSRLTARACRVRSARRGTSSAQSRDWAGVLARAAIASASASETGATAAPEAARARRVRAMPVSSRMSSVRAAASRPEAASARAMAARRSIGLRRRSATISA